MEAELLAELLSELRSLKERVQAPLPVVLTLRRAAEELSISVSKLRGMIRRGDVLTCEVGRVQMVPRSELERLATPRASPALRRAGGGRPKAARAAASSEAESIRAALRKARTEP